MYFELENKTYCVKFYRQNTTTFAELLAVTDEGLSYTGLIAFAILHPNDRFEKSKGRKVALAYLLEILSDHNTESPFNPLKKEQRQYIWQKYFERHNK